MKQSYKIFMFILAGFAVSCEKFVDIHEEYVKDGEIIYAPKVDSVQFVAGKGRVQFGFWLKNAPNVKSVDLYWNSNSDSLTTSISPTTGLDSFYVVVPDLPEGAYTFEVKTRDNFDHSSLYLTGFGNSYGDFYQSSLANRRVKSIDLTDVGGIIEWFGALDGMIWTDIRYMATDGKTKTVRLDAGASSIVCPGAKAGTSFEFSSSFIPEELSIDTFSVDWEEHAGNFPLIYRYDRTDWRVLEVSDETASDGGGMHTLLDGNLGTFWHSKWDGGSAPLPHWAVIDMNSPRRIIKIDTYRRSGTTDSKTIQFFVGPDPDADAASWTKIGESGFVSGKDNVETLISNSVSTLGGRYLKLVLPDSNRDPFTSIAEVYLYTD